MLVRPPNGDSPSFHIITNSAFFFTSSLRLVGPTCLNMLVRPPNECTVLAHIGTGKSIIIRGGRESVVLCILLCVNTLCQVQRS